MVSPSQNPINSYGPLNEAGTVGGGMFGQGMTEGGNLKLARHLLRGVLKSGAVFTNELGNRISLTGRALPENMVNYKLTGPTSVSDQTVTRMEAQRLHALLGKILGMRVVNKNHRQKQAAAPLGTSKPGPGILELGDRNVRQVVGDAKPPLTTPETPDLPLRAFWESLVDPEAGYAGVSKPRAVLDDEPYLAASRLARLRPELAPELQRYADQSTSQWRGKQLRPPAPGQQPTAPSSGVAKPLTPQAGPAPSPAAPPPPPSPAGPSWFDRNQDNLLAGGLAAGIPLSYLLYHLATRRRDDEEKQAEAWWDTLGKVDGTSLARNVGAGVGIGGGSFLAINALANWLRRRAAAPEDREGISLWDDAGLVGGLGAGVGAAKGVRNTIRQHDARPKAAAVNKNHRPKQADWKDTLGKILNSHTLRYGLGGAGVGAGVGALSHYAAGEDAWEGAGIGGAIGAGAGLATGGLRDYLSYTSNKQWDELKKPRPGGLPNRPGKTSLRDQVGRYYRNAPGGFDRAVSEAQKHVPRGEAMGLQPWDPAGVDRRVPYQLVDKEVLGGDDAGGVLGAGRVDPDSLEWDDLLIAAPDHKLTDQAKNVMEHEVTHRGLQPKGMNPAESIARYVGEGPVAPYRGATSRVQQPFWDYAATPEEFKAWLAPVKREWVRSTGRHLTTDEDALQAVNAWLNNPANQGRDIDPARRQTTDFLRSIKDNPLARHKMIQQLLQVVKGGPAPGGDKLASAADFAKGLARDGGPGSMVAAARPGPASPATQPAPATGQGQQAPAVPPPPSPTSNSAGRGRAAINRQLSRTPRTPPAWLARLQQSRTTRARRPGA